MKKPTLTIGIPIKNEENNIGSLLFRLLKQTNKNYKLDKIIVYSNGTTDNSIEVVKSIKSKKIKLIVDDKRIGQQLAQNKISRLSSSDYLLLLEGDTLPSNKKYIDTLYKSVKSKHIAVIQGLPYSLVGKSIVGKALSSQSRFYVNYFKKLDIASPRLFAGQGGRLIPKKIYKKIKWQDKKNEDQYLYKWCLKNGFEYIIQPNAHSLFRSPETIVDYTKKRLKMQKGNVKFKKRYKASTSEKIILFSKFFRSAPMNCLVFIFSVACSRLMVFFIKEEEYFYATSTKKLAL